jgi:hypothetical protein
MKIDLFPMSRSERLLACLKYCRRKQKDAKHAGGHQDPYVSLDDLRRRFKVDTLDRKQAKEVFAEIITDLRDVYPHIDEQIDAALSAGRKETEG